MMRSWKLLLVTAGAIALSGALACSSGTELNPQPLPPGSEDPRGPEGAVDKGDNSGGTSGSSGSTGATPGAGADAGAEGGDAAGDH